VQGCIPLNYNLNNDQIKALESLEVINLWCPWDNALISYLLISGKLTVGLRGFERKYRFIKNQFSLFTKDLTFTEAVSVIKKSLNILTNIFPKKTKSVIRPDLFDMI
jgi:hypothetical protein